MDNEFALSKYNYQMGMYFPLEGTGDFIEVVTMGDGGYEWCEFRAYYSPNARRYFWKGDSGCSCNSWDDDIDSAADLENGDKEALLRAWETFAKDKSYEFNDFQRQEGISKIRGFTPPSVPVKEETRDQLKDPDWDF